jgi:hypothetical protein
VTVASSDDDDRRREEIRALLEGGLRTEAFPRADTHQEVQEVVARLRAEVRTVADRLVISGMTLTTVVHQDLAQPCETCMYYLVHRRYCELPELDLPVEPEWSCRLWRI